MAVSKKMGLFEILIRILRWVDDEIERTKEENGIDIQFGCLVSAEYFLSEFFQDALYVVLCGMKTNLKT
jgi:hypothetical protein